MCKHFPDIEERRTNWINRMNGSFDELELLTAAQCIKKFYEDNHHTPRVEMFAYKVEQGFQPEIDIEDDDLLLDGINQEFPGDECVLKGVKRPNDNTSRYMRTKLAKSRHMNNVHRGKSVPIYRGENGEYTYNGQDADEFEKTIVATKECPKSESGYKRMDRRKLRHDGRAECREIPETPEEIKEEEREFFPEKEDGTVDVDFCLRHNWMFRDLDDGIYGHEYDDDDDWDDDDYDDDYEPEYMSREWCEMECIDYPEDDYDDEDEEEEALTYAENSRLKREIATYRDFIGEYNLGKLYQTWLAQNGKGAM